MSLKAKLFTTLAALCMVICLLTVGVWAISQTTVTVNGTVSFVANDVYATVKLTTTGAKTNLDGAANTITFNSSKEAGDIVEADPKWEIADLEFSEKNTAIVLVFEVENLNTERTLGVKVDVLSHDENANIEVLVDEEANEATATAKADGVETNKVQVKVNITIVDTNKEVDAAAWKVQLTLTDPKHVGA